MSESPKAFAVRTILVPHDLSALSDAALRRGIAIATAAGARLHLIHARQPAGPEAPEVPPHTSEAALAEIAGRHGGRLHTREDAPAHAICSVAVEIGADLIVMASYRDVPFARALVSSAVVRTIRHAPCDVLVVTSAT